MVSYITRCPFCGHSEFIEGMQGGSDAYVTAENIFGQRLYHILCRNCGSVVRSYVKNPEKLLKKKNRREFDL